MKTSYFGKLKSIDMGKYFPVSIAVGNRFYTGYKFPALAPTWDMVKAAKSGDKGYYWSRYEKQLSSLDKKIVYDTIVSEANGKEPVLLCWEKDVNCCHRKRVAEWLNEAGYNVTEL